MNIFFLSNDPTEAAQYHGDKHNIKMILEQAQLLSTAHRVLDGDAAVDTSLYKSTHKNHPCAIWVRESASNYTWTYNLFAALCEEYTFRYGKQHKSGLLLLDKLKILPKNIAHIGMTRPALAMPDDYKSDDPVKAYREYYIHDKLKKNIVQYNKNRPPPDWISKYV